MNIYILILILQGKATFKKHNKKVMREKQNNPYTEENKKLREFIKTRDKLWKQETNKKTKEEQKIIDKRSNET